MKFSAEKARQELANLVESIKSILSKHEIDKMPQPYKLAKDIYRFVNIIYPKGHAFDPISDLERNKANRNEQFKLDMKEKYGFDITDSSEIKDYRERITNIHTEVLRSVVSRLYPMFPNYVDVDPVNLLGQQYIVLIEKSIKYKHKNIDKPHKSDEIDRQERSTPFALPTYETIKSLDKLYRSRVDKNMFRCKDPKYLSSLRVYWNRFTKELMLIFPYVKYDDILFEPMEYTVGIGIEPYWFEICRSPKYGYKQIYNITALYYEMVNRSLIEPDNDESFEDIFKARIILGSPTPIIWSGVFKQQCSDRECNATMLYFLISALRNWSKFQKFVEGNNSEGVKEILTKHDRDNIARFFKGKSQPIYSKSLKLVRDQFSAEYIVELISSFRSSQ